ncbi:MAG: hypothetical protein GX620_09380 [Chloroflexi bacterium]|nr:hypothetical protein [Chloroflexota bacterium]
MTPVHIVRHLAIKRRHRLAAREQGGLRQILRIASVLALAVAATVVVVIAGGVASAVGAYSYFTRDLPALEQVEQAEQTFETSKIYDRTGQILLYEVIDPTGGDRTWVTLDQMPENILCATVAIEDRTFWENPGINIRGIARAFWANIRGQEIQGGSSITQQLIKNVIIEPEKRYIGAEGAQWEDYERKITEILLAYRITQRYSKEQILEWYLNTNPYANLAYGIEAAARVYFGKTVGELTLSEAATLAAIPQYPLLNPFDDPQAARERQALVLDAMVKQGCITPEEAVAAKYEPWNLSHITERYDILAPHFSVYARKQLERMYGTEVVYRGGLRVYTTIDLDLQNQAQCVAQAHVRRLSGEDEATVIQEALDSGCVAAQFLPALRASQVGRDHNVSNASVVVLRPGTGEILAMVGSLDYWNNEIDGQFNVAVDGTGRQPGSSFKPFTYLTMLSQGYNAAHMFLDVRSAFQQGTGYPYVPENYDRQYHGAMRMRTALANSYNIPAVEAMQIAGVDNVIRIAHRMGINTLDEGLDYYGLSLTLGGGEVHVMDMAYAFSVLANGGAMYGTPIPPNQVRAGYRELDPVAILRVEDRNGRILYEYDQPETQEILSPQLAYLMNSMLSDQRARYAEFGHPNALEMANDRPAAAKTGTTNNYRDAWTVGYTPQLVTAVWVGNTDNSEMVSLAGISGAAPIWRAVMEYELRDAEIAPFVRPDGLIEMAVCSLSGKLPGPECPTVNELFIPGTEPREHCTIHQTFRVNRETGRLCTVFSPPELCEERVYHVYPPEAADWLASLPEEQRPATPPTEYDTIYGPSQRDAEVAIMYPSPYSYIAATVPITGSARGGDFNYYRVVFGQGLNPTEWIQIGSDHGEQVDQGVLEYWDTTGLDGLYSLRLSVVDHSSALRETTIQVTVDNVAPTVDLTYPQNGAVFRSGFDEWVNINAEVRDVSIDRVEFYSYPGSTTPEGELTPFAIRTVAPYNVNFIITGVGTRSFHVVAVDAAGNETRTPPTTVSVAPREQEE